MRTDDFRINARVRAVLVRKWIDTSKCTIGTIKGKVFIRGRIRRIFGRDERHINSDEDEDESPTNDIHELTLIQQIEDEIKRIPDVVGIQFDLEYWKKEKGVWKRRVM
jgi:hypothetical protein